MTVLSNTDIMFPFSLPLTKFYLGHKSGHQVIKQIQNKNIVITGNKVQVITQVINEQRFVLLVFYICFRR